MLSTLERQFDYLWEELHPEIDLETEVKLIPKRQFRFDYVQIESKVCIELNGGIYIKSGHTSPKGIMRDYEKTNLAQCLGYLTFQLSSEMINEYWLNNIEKVIKTRLGLNI
jgi:hypothetical protein